MKKILLSTIILFSTLLAFSNNRSEIDSLVNVILQMPDDSNKVIELLAASKKCYGTHYEKGIELAKEAIQTSKEINYSIGVRNGLNKIAYHNLRIGKYEKALEHFFQCIEEDEKNRRKVKVGDDYLNIGNVYYYQGSESSVEYWLKAEKIYEEHDNMVGLSFVYGNICGYYKDIGKLESAKAYGEKALEIAIEMGDEMKISDMYNNLANIFISRFGNDSSKAHLYDAIEYYEKALKLYTKLNLPQRTAITYDNLGVAYDRLRNFKKGRHLHFKALEIYNEIGDKEGKHSSFDHLSRNYQATGEFEKALAFRDSTSIINALLRSEAADKAMAEMQTKYESEKKEKENQLLKKDNLLKEATLQQKETIEIVMSGGIGALFIIVGLIFYQFRQKKKANILLNEQNEEILSQNEEILSQRDFIERQNEILAQKNDHIMSSIQYAKRIQEAILPSDELLIGNLPDSFVLYKPKDVVSGDFYWMEVVDSMVFWAAVDCTGHGVPGAFMSILGANGLKKIVMERGIYKPSEILSHLTDHVINSIKSTKEGEEVKDGMDISLCCWDKATNKLQWAGAYNPLFVVRKGELTDLPSTSKVKMLPFDPDNESKGGLYEIKATKRPIGRFKRRDLPDFTNHEFQLLKEDSLYVFTDGFADQFGGGNGSKFTSRRMKELILNNIKKPMSEQLEILSASFEEWRGDEEQLDDICIFGVRV